MSVGKHTLLVVDKFGSQAPAGMMRVISEAPPCRFHPVKLTLPTASLTKRNRPKSKLALFSLVVTCVPIVHVSALPISALCTRYQYKSCVLRTLHHASGWFVSTGTTSRSHA